MIDWLSEMSILLKKSANPTLAVVTFLSLSFSIISTHLFVFYFVVNMIQKEAESNIISTTSSFPSSHLVFNSPQCKHQEHQYITRYMYRMPVTAHMCRVSWAIPFHLDFS